MRRKPIQLPEDYPLEGWYRDRVDEMIGLAVSSTMGRNYVLMARRDRQNTPEYRKAEEKRARRAKRLARQLGT